MSNEDLLQQIVALQQQVAALQAVAPHAGEKHTLCDNVRQKIPVHLQVGSQLSADERKTTLAKWRKFEDWPLPLGDKNGLAGKVLQGQGQLKQFVTSDISKFQRNELDIIRMAADAWDACIGNDYSTEQKADRAVQALRDITILSTDNAQFMAKRQLECIFEGAKAKGAYALLRMDQSEESDIDLASAEMFQPSYANAVKEFRKVTKTVEPQNKQPPFGSRGGFNNRRGGFRGRGGSFSNGRHFHSRQNGGYQGNSYHGNRSQYQGNGRGNGGGQDP